MNTPQQEDSTPEVLETSELGATETKTTDIPRTLSVATVSEPMSLIAEREVNNWRKRCIEFKMPVFSDENWAGVFAGIVAGLAGAWWASDFTEHPDREFALQLAIVLCGLIALAFGLKAFSQRRKTGTDLSKLAEEMHGACEAGLGRFESVKSAFGKAEADQKAGA